MAAEYDFKSIEAKWQKAWLENKTFKAEDTSKKPKYYILDMFPYPSGDGLHVGHPEGYTATDILARYKRMRGFNVLHPMGWDSFGLPAEQYAIQTGTHPRVTTEKNINRFREQIRSMGFSYDWDREITTSSVDYYRWTQWIFLRLYEKGLAYESFAPVNWCPELGTVLANEEVVDGKSERGGYPVERKPMRQWVLKITEYADRLEEDLKDLDWPESIKDMQRNWIGKSHGAEVRFDIQGLDNESFVVFTTRPDTLFGATFCVLAPEHPLVEKIVSDEKRKLVADYVTQAGRKSDLDRMSDEKDKSGVFTGGYAINPVNQEPIPIYVADYVLMSYGTGAIMAVPGHDERDHAFAKKYDIEIRRVLTGGDDDISDAAHMGDGELVNSDFLNGKTKSDAIAAITDWLVAQAKGKATINYKLRDWLFSRQRYWGEPFPLAHDVDGTPVALTDSDLPIILPELTDFKPAGTGESPLAKAGDWLSIEQNGKALRRETNTMPQWAGSCWYYLRYIDPQNTDKPWDPEKEKYWMPVDLYIGGAEHAVLHLLYARFWHKVLFDLGYVSTKEPFQKLVNQGMILGENGEKMSKSRGNVVNPDDVIASWGADAFRMYEMFMGPLEASKPWQTSGIGGCFRFLKRVWRLIIDESGNVACGANGSASESLEKQRHKMVKKVTEDLEHLRFNTAISAMMEFVNEVYRENGGISKDHAMTLVQVVAPFAPHMGEELWQRLGHADTISFESWPTYDADLVSEDTVRLSIQVNGKVRGTLDIAIGASKDDVLSQAKDVDRVKKYLDGMTLVKEIYVPEKIVSLVVKPKA